MSDPTRCCATHVDGSQCICMRAKDTYIDEEIKRTLCQSYSHIESAHPEPKPGAGAIIRGFRDAAKAGSSSSGLSGSSSTSSSAIESSYTEAEAETSAGLRANMKKRKSDTDVEPLTKKSSKGKAKAPKTEGQKVAFGKLVLLPCGLDSYGALLEPRVPLPAAMDHMRSAGLVVLDSPRNSLIINTSWDNKRVNAEIKRLLPQPIAFLERQPYSGSSGDSDEVKSQLWLGVIRQSKNLMVAADPLPTGVELADHCKALGRVASDRVLFLASKTKIPRKRWDWAESESEDLGSDADTVPSEEIINTPRKAAPKKKFKVKREPGKFLILFCSLSNQSSGIDSDSDLRKAAKMRTRLSNGTISRQNFLIPGSSNGIEEPVAGPSGANVVLILSDDDDLPPASTLGSLTWNPAPVPPADTTVVPPVPMVIAPVLPTITPSVPTPVPVAPIVSSFASSSASWGPPTPTHASIGSAPPSWTTGTDFSGQLLSDPPQALRNGPLGIKALCSIPSCRIPSSISVDPCSP
ncbi:hypothetical protein C8R45DRAFT_1099923 [Mycena sanguinolenta]|nr:hypothetical protein C8R45DRAFT_1099923 [Mycena sanguinolenta]